MLYIIYMPYLGMFIKQTRRTYIYLYYLNQRFLKPTVGIVSTARSFMVSVVVIGRSQSWWENGWPGRY